MQFTPLKDFHSPELKSDYVKGLSYTLRPANQPGISAREKAGREKLAVLLPKWIAEGKVRYGSPDVPDAGTVSGEGTVS